MKIIETIKIKIDEEKDLLNARSIIREFCDKLGFRQVQKVKLLTAASELVRNILKYAEKGTCTISSIEQQTKGIEVICQDKGKGIEDLIRAQQKGYSSGGSLGLGLSGSKALADFFWIDSKPNEGTTVRIIIWKSR